MRAIVRTRADATVLTPVVDCPSSHVAMSNSNYTLACHHTALRPQFRA
jgi:hypothetical protein